MLHQVPVPFFALATVSGDTIQTIDFIENTARMEKARAGLAAIKHLFQSNRADAVLTREIGEIAFHALRDYYIEVYSCLDAPLADVLSQFARGALPLLSGPTHASEAAGARCAESKHWELGGDGALEFADAVIDACNEENDFKFLYPLEMKLRDRVETIAKEVYGADGVTWSAEAEAKAKMLENDSKYDGYATMMVKTHLSLTHDPVLKGVPKGWTLPIRDVLIYSGAKFLCPCAGAISLMPGTGSNPAFRRIDVDTENGKVSGLF